MKLLACVAAAVAAFAQSNPAKIENDQVRVLVVNQAPHQKTRLHKHDVNRVMIYLQAGAQTIDYQKEGVKHLNWKAGQALWSPASGMHIAEITSPDAVTIAEVELKKPGAKAAVKYPAQDPVKVDPKHYKIEMENDQVRVLRVKIGPGESTPVHEHGLNRVLVYLTGMDFRVTGDDGKPQVVTHQAGEVSWGTPTRHKEENVSSKPFEVVVIEIKS